MLCHLPTCWAVYLHHIDPVAFQLGPVLVRWYGLSYILGFLIGYLLIRQVARRGISSLRPEHVGDLVVTLAIGVVVGGRLGYVLFYRPSLLWEFTSSLPFWGLLAINNGGMASHGGIIGFLLAAAIYARRHGHSWWHLIDLGAFAAPMGLFFGRLANFVNGELYGRPASADLPWAVKFPQEIYSWDAEQPEKVGQLFVSLQDAGVHVGSSLGEVLRLMQRGDQQVVAAVAPLLTPRHPSQIYEALLEGLLLFTVLAIVWIRPRKPMVIAGWFGVVYGVGRIVAECFREPDLHLRHLEFTWWHITRGQWLSIPVILTGLVMIVLAQRSKTPLMGSWRSPPGSDSSAQPGAPSAS